MSRNFGLLTIWCVALGAGAAPAPAPTLARADPAPQLREQIIARIGQSRYQHAAWGIKIISLDSGVVLFGHQSHKLLKPASNAKLFTGALVLDRLAPDYRIRTSVLAAHKPNNQGVIEGDLVVYGRGDPTLAARFENGQYEVGLRRLAEAVVSAGVKEISGDLVGDESYFTGGPAGANWAWEDLAYYYGAEVSALTLEDNVIDLVLSPAPRVGEPCLIEGLPKTEYLTFINRSTTRPNEAGRTLTIDRPLGENKVYVRGSLPVQGAPQTNAVTVHEPARFFVTQLRAELLRRSVRAGGQLRVRDGRAPAATNGLVEVAFILSRPLREILPKMLKPSQNLYAQLLLLQAGAAAGSGGPEGEPPDSTEELGIAELTRFLAAAGIPSDEVLLDEGSGLSRSALVTPDAIVRLLQHLDRHRWREVWLESLPVAGVDGTLRNRMRRSAAAGNARAKTGSLRFVNTLSGYVTSAAGERLAYCLMVNNCRANANEVRNDLDAIVVQLAELKTRTRSE